MGIRCRCRRQQFFKSWRLDMCVAKQQGWKTTRCVSRVQELLWRDHGNDWREFENQTSNFRSQTEFMEQDTIQPQIRGRQIFHEIGQSSLHFWNHSVAAWTFTETDFGKRGRVWKQTERFGLVLYVLLPWCLARWRYELEILQRQ